MSEPNERVDGYDPANPPQGRHWCAVCARWDDECECDPDEIEKLPDSCLPPKDVLRDLGFETID